MMAPKTRAVFNLVCTMLGFVGLALFTIGYVADQARKQCGIVILIDDRNQAMPPATDPDTARYRAELHHYRESIGC